MTGYSTVVTIIGKSECITGITGIRINIYFSF